MSGSLRVRFFLIVWPLVVGTVVAVGWAFGRWTRVEIRREAVLSEKTESGAHPADLAWFDAVVDAPDWATVQDRLMASGHDAFVVDASGRLLAQSDRTFTISESTVDPAGVLTIVVRMDERWTETETRLRMPGYVVAVPEALSDGLALPIRVYPVSNLGTMRGEIDELMAEAIGDRGAGFIAAADRAIWISVAVASLFAALATLWLARMVARPAQAFATAAHRVRAGDLSARVPTMSGDELGPVAEAFNAMAQELERSEAFKRRMISDAAHELRTPLTNVIGTLEAVDDGFRPADAGTIASLREEARLLERLVDDLQELAVADSGGLQLDLGPVDLRAMSDGVAAAFAAQAQAQGVDISVSGHGTAWADESRVGQVLRNLLSNAVTHAPAQSTVEVEVASARVSVIDRGPGIPAVDLPHVWERFYRVEGSRSRDTGGRGLGLAIVKRLVEAQNGSVRVTSVLGEGARFDVHLPSYDTA